jgi:hypothetical protein
VRQRLTLVLPELAELRRALRRLEEERPEEP